MNEKEKKKRVNEQHNKEAFSESTSSRDNIIIFKILVLFFDFENNFDFILVIASQYILKFKIRFQTLKKYLENFG